MSVRPAVALILGAAACSSAARPGPAAPTDPADLGDDESTTRSAALPEPGRPPAERSLDEMVADMITEAGLLQNGGTAAVGAAPSGAPSADAAMESANACSASLALAAGEDPTAAVDLVWRSFETELADLLERPVRCDAPETEQRARDEALSDLVQQTISTRTQVTDSGEEEAGDEPTVLRAAHGVRADALMIRLLWALADRAWELENCEHDGWYEAARRLEEVAGRVADELAEEIRRLLPRLSPDACIAVCAWAPADAGMRERGVACP